MNSKWLRCVHRQQNSQVRLICFPWAGGGAAFYGNWGKKFTREIEGFCQFFFFLVLNLLILNENWFPNDSCNYSSRYPALSELTRRTDTPKIIISPIFLALIKDFNFIEFYMTEI